MKIELDDLYKELSSLPTKSLKTAIGPESESTFGPTHTSQKYFLSFRTPYLEFHIASHSTSMIMNDCRSVKVFYEVDVFDEFRIIDPTYKKIDENIQVVILDNKFMTNLDQRIRERVEQEYSGTAIYRGISAQKILEEKIQEISEKINHNQKIIEEQKLRQEVSYFLDILSEQTEMNKRLGELILQRKVLTGEIYKR